MDNSSHPDIDPPEELSDDAETLKQWGIYGGIAIGGLFGAFLFFNYILAFAWFLVKWSLMGLGVYGAYRLGQDYLGEDNPKKLSDLREPSAPEVRDQPPQQEDIGPNVDDPLADRELEKELEELQAKAHRDD